MAAAVLRLALNYQHNLFLFHPTPGAAIGSIESQRPVVVSHCRLLEEAARQHLQFLSPDLRGRAAGRASRRS